MKTNTRSKQAELPTRVPPSNATPPNHRAAKQHAEAKQTQQFLARRDANFCASRGHTTKPHKKKSFSDEHKTEAIGRSSKGVVGTESNTTSHELAW